MSAKNPSKPRPRRVDGPRLSTVRTSPAIAAKLDRLRKAGRKWAIIARDAIERAYRDAFGTDAPPPESTPAPPRRNGRRARA